MTDAADLRKALEQADAACPCNRLFGSCHECAEARHGECVCNYHDERRGTIGVPCLWPGHAAIREAMRVAAEWGYCKPNWLRELAAILGAPEK